MKVTADTITDEQIRELLRAAEAHAYPGSDPVWRDAWNAAHDALGSNGREACIDRGYSITPHMREQARARCAEILNARRQS